VAAGLLSRRVSVWKENNAETDLSLVPEPGPRRVYLLATLINTYGIGWSSPR